jgi:hypothetical protein
MKIISLYPSNDVYQIVSEDESTIYFQGSQADCKRRIKKFRRNEELRATIQSSLYRKSRYLY